MCLSRHLDLGWRVQHLGENQVIVMASLARTVQLVHGDVVARQVWAIAVGSPLKWSLMATILGLMKRSYILMLFRIYDGHLGLKTKMRLTTQSVWMMTRWVRTKTLQLLNETL